MIAVFDTETTGLLLPSSAPLDAQPRIIEIAVALIQKGKIYTERSWLLDPGVSISVEITKITGLTNDDLKGQPSFQAILPPLKSLFSLASIVIGHNIMFDVTMVNNELKRLSPYDSFPWPATQLCTVSMYDHLQGWRHSQEKLYERIIGKPAKQTHRALDDVKQLVEILKKDKVFTKLEKGVK